MKSHHLWGFALLLIAYVIGARYPGLAAKFGLS